ncbi:cell division protein CrgA [Zhihengliuella sp.]|uniref:cell division protein CrgA n=1 Tax=Zhihengliuella sp. TaxID=1954483 RepID=UPI002811E21C|nr:cell division protein CrgA [Zhihengliuella sp.]
MPESKTRRKARRQADPAAATERMPLPLWYKIIMFGSMILGLLWIIVYYVTQSLFPIMSIGGWNIVIGFGIAMVGFFMTTRWHA